MRAVRATAAGALAVLFGLLLGLTARWFADGMTVNGQLFFHAFRLSNLHSNWVYAPLRFLSAGILQYSALVSWAVLCGYACARAGGRAARALLGAFIAGVLLGTAVTTTSVRIAQPQFFEGVVAATIHPFGVTLAFIVVPACLAWLAVRRRRAPAAVVVTVAVLAVLLTAWNAADLGNALTFGCVLSAGGYCTSRGNLPAVVSAAGLVALAGWMAWDALASSRKSPG